MACPRFATNIVSTIAMECLKIFKLFRGPSTGKLSLTLWLVMESGCSLQAPCLPESDFRAEEAVTVITDPQHRGSLGPCLSLPKEADNRKLLNQVSVGPMILTKSSLHPSSS